MSARAATPKRKSKVRAPANGRQQAAETTRKAMLTAAVETIAELGYYRASSNEIARRAGFTWGVIQHHFKSREGLLLAVIHDQLSDELTSMSRAKVMGRSLEARVASFCAATFAVYAAPSYVAVLQILLDLSRDPTHGEATRNAVNAFSRGFTRQSLRLAREVSPQRDVSDDLAQFLGEAVWGVSMTEHIGRIYWSPSFEKRRVSVERAELVHALVARFRGLGSKASEKSKPCKKPRKAR